jgi:hypothetical protein
MLNTSLSNIVCQATAITILLADFASAAGTMEWQEQVIDSASGPTYSSLNIDRHGNAHVSYINDAEHLLKYAFWDSRLQKWFTTVVDTSRGFCSLALDSLQRPHIAYLAYGEGQLKYAFWDGASWQKQLIRLRVRDVSFYTSLALDSQDHPSISYYEYWNATDDQYTLALRNVWWSGRFWEVRTVDPTQGSGKFNAMATDSSRNPHIVYANVKYENASIRYARWSGQSWETTIVEGDTPGYVGQSVSLVVDQYDVPHITYTDQNRRMIRYATRRNGKWDFQTVDVITRGAYPDRNSIAIAQDGTPYISYYDAGRGVLKLASRGNGGWETEIVDENAGFSSSLQIANGEIWITYTGQNGAALKCARRSLNRPAVTGDGTGAQGSALQDNSFRKTNDKH